MSGMSLSTKKRENSSREITCWSPHLATDVCCSFYAVRLSRNRQPRAFRRARARRPKSNVPFVFLEWYWQIISSVTQWRIRSCLSLFFFFFSLSWRGKCDWNATLATRSLCRPLNKLSLYSRRHIFPSTKRCRSDSCSQLFFFYFFTPQTLCHRHAIYCPRQREPVKLNRNDVI